MPLYVGIKAFGVLRRCMIPMPGASLKETFEDTEVVQVPCFASEGKCLNFQRCRKYSRGDFFPPAKMGWNECVLDGFFGCLPHSLKKTFASQQINAGSQWNSFIHQETEKVRKRDISNHNRKINDYVFSFLVSYTKAWSLEEDVFMLFALFIMLSDPKQTNVHSGSRRKKWKEKVC